MVRLRRVTGPIEAGVKSMDGCEDESVFMISIDERDYLFAFLSRELLAELLGVALVE